MTLLSRRPIRPVFMSAIQASKLQPCPFCWYARPVQTHDGSKYYIKCGQGHYSDGRPKCGAKGPARRSALRAAQAWGMRP